MSTKPYLAHNQKIKRKIEKGEVAKRFKWVKRKEFALSSVRVGYILIPIIKTSSICSRLPVQLSSVLFKIVRCSEPGLL